ncbi:ATP-binding cassette, subfamily C, CydD [Microbacterium sp. cf046]|uniref:thiol reductant ABC exporter subunit CydD n=1 Tax=Microbacterium sp. cf046 TaxID=1761803 RepID=UPI0008EF62E3|nr:thiol reductant ABC exporter subunit CydD [Microbacterium sp. cf046]SFS16085.1 ATP-binding cassette, subfamily C, CydD [Microbacterium sp. cf046]
MSETVDAPPRERVRPVDPRLLRYARASRTFFVLITIIGVAQTAVIVAIAWLLTIAITGAIDGMPLPGLATTLIWLTAAFAARAALLWVREWASARAAARVQLQLRSALVDAVGDLGPGWLSTRNSAQLAVTAGRGLDALDAYFGRYLPQLVLTVIATPVIVLVMWSQDWISGLTVLLTLPLIPIFMVLIGLATRTVQKRQWQTLTHLAARFSDTVHGLSTLKVFGRQGRAAASIERVTDDYRRETMKVLRVSFMSGFTLEFLASISVAIIAVSIGFRLLDGSLSLVVGLFVLLLAPEAYLPLRKVGVQFHAAAEGVAATDDVFGVLDAARTSGTRAPRGSGAAPAHGDLVVRDLVVRYGDDVLPPLSLHAPPGTVTLIEGPSGAGKSSLFAALRGAAAWSGRASYGGVDVARLSPSQWLAWSGQQPALIAGTIASNVALGDADADGALVSAALGLATAGDLDPAFVLGVQGAGLSGGQAQRVSVARAVYRLLSGRADVIALDEPSAALDGSTEVVLWANLRELADRGATVLLVSHRVSARSIADEIVRVEAREVMA